MTKPDGGPSYPRTAADPNWGLGTASYEGMSLRDYFAAAALQGYMSIPDDRNYSGRAKEFKDLSVEEWQGTLLSKDAELCYRYADAMLEAREK
jgi:hypothetical protein